MRESFRGSPCTVPTQVKSAIKARLPALDCLAAHSVEKHPSGKKEANMLFKNLKNIVKVKTQKNVATAKTPSNIVKGFQVIEDECIWSKAGIVQSRLCDNVYDCRTCPFDRAMQKTVNADSKQRGSGWANNVKDIYDWTNIPCRHVLTGRVSAAKVCTNNYECNHCAYDQMLDDEDMDFRDEKTACLKSSGYLLAEEYYYHKGHTWARFEHGGRVKIGFDDFMVKLFGSPSNISLPPPGRKTEKRPSRTCLFPRR
jgi:hypothetical protein